MVVLTLRAKELIKELAEELKASNGGELEFHDYRLAKFDAQTGEPKAFTNHTYTEMFIEDRLNAMAEIRRDEDPNARYELKGRRRFVLGTETFEWKGKVLTAESDF